MHYDDGLIDFNDVSAAVDVLWGGCRGLSLICRLCHTPNMQSRHSQEFVGLLYPVPLLLCAFATCLPWCLRAQPQRTVLPFLPLASSLFCFRLARVRFRCQYLSSLRFTSGCLCSASFAPLYSWHLRTAPNKKFVSACDCHSFAARDRAISTVPS